MTHPIRKLQYRRERREQFWAMVRKCLCFIGVQTEEPK